MKEKPSLQFSLVNTHLVTRNKKDKRLRRTCLICNYKVLKCLLCALSAWMGKYFEDLKSAIWLLQEDTTYRHLEFLLLIKKCCWALEAEISNKISHPHLRPTLYTSGTIHPAQDYRGSENPPSTDTIFSIPPPSIVYLSLGPQTYDKQNIHKKTARVPC